MRHPEEDGRNEFRGELSRFAGYGVVTTQEFAGGAFTLAQLMVRHVCTDGLWQDCKPISGFVLRSWQCCLTIIK